MRCSYPVTSASGNVAVIEPISFVSNVCGRAHCGVLGTGTDAWLLELTAGQFGSVWPVHARPGPVARGPAGCDVVFENDRPVVDTYAEAGAFVLHQAALGASLLPLKIICVAIV